ncbi:MAG: N-acetylmuramoyl-L-alanine amidase [Polyangiaceae bacterium]|nr:N-acetylmuramoyl-L-alanine amidase [Polyangiaceae bacterium]
MRRVAPSRPLSPPPGLPTQGVLHGKTVYLSAGHGFTWLNGSWMTQRTTMESLVEDLMSAETVNQYLIPQLRNMGAYVVPMRDPDLQTQLVIVDDDDVTLEGSVDELASAESGWGELTYPISSGTNPFEVGGTRLFSTSSQATGRLLYAPEIPASGYYNVYVSYVQGPDRASDAHYVVAHAGGESHFRVDQRRHGMTWAMLGRFWFEAGAPTEEASVSLWNDSQDAGTTLSADAVRFGAGRGRIDRGGGANDRPMWENNCRYNAQLGGAPPSVYDALSDDMLDDIAGRGRFASWDHEPGEDAVYVAWHTNGSVQRGTESFTYSPFGNNGFGSQADFTGVPGGIELQDAVHGRLVSELRAHWDSSWIDRGKLTAYFGEVNPANNPEMPSVLVEVAFHDHPVDADSLREPHFRELAAGAIARGIATYFAEKDGIPLVLPPDPPIALRVENDGAGALRVSWLPPESGEGPVDGYRVYVSTQGYGFDDGHDTTAESYTLADLSPGDVRYVRVASRNAGGVSMPTESAGARVAVLGRAPVLIVGGFDRLDAGLMPVEDLSDYGMAPAQRMFLDRMNDGSYAARHGGAIADAGFSFDGTTDDAVSRGHVLLDHYDAVDWFVGESSLGDEPLDLSERGALRDYLGMGGRVLISGSELAWAQSLASTEEERSFYRDVLGAEYVADDAETYDLDTEPSGIFEGLGTLHFEESGPGSYDAEYADVLSPGVRAMPLLSYAAGAGGAAAIQFHDEATGANVVTFGFPFETIVGADRRRDVMTRVLVDFGVEPDPEAPPSGGGGGATGSADGAGANAGGGGAAFDGFDDNTGCSCHTPAEPTRTKSIVWVAFGLSALAFSRRLWRARGGSESTAAQSRSPRRRAGRSPRAG